MHGHFQYTLKPLTQNHTHIKHKMETTRRTEKFECWTVQVNRDDGFFVHANEIIQEMVKEWIYLAWSSNCN